MVGVSGRARTRRLLSAAALSLFAENGYDSTTVDQIAAAAGVARRTFFRYFPTKEDAVFPDHDSTLVKVSLVLEAEGDGEEPITVVCRAIREVLRMYAAEAEVSVARYRLLRQVPALREREIAVVSRYERLFTKYLLAHPSASASPDSPDAPLMAEVSAAAVVAAHNHVLRRWLRGGGTGDAMAQLDHALRAVRDGLVDPRRRMSDRRVVVTVTQAGSGVDEVLDAVRHALN
ncbi:TetR family transcriptional regulator [Stackebrandtia albiflava]|uniref:TetR family transcriptional regulator n=1 Tax=Stackebrandtia albiflava TaxID=406432 RepID=A0A562UPZ7_9ACTN|nr:TetR family transcriptional regulator [Stackebrandtia albiflava]TWJ07692.1 TetR family transcriptional regulator [Stackebrandtia albiflava]